MIGEIHLRTKKKVFVFRKRPYSQVVCQKGNLAKPINIPNFGNQPHFFTKSLGHEWIIDLFQGTNRLLRKAIALNLPLSKPVPLGSYMLSREATVSHKLSPTK